MGGTVTTAFVDNDSVQFYLPPVSMYDGSIPPSYYSIVIDNKNNKWMSTSKDIFRFDGVNWTQYNSGNMPVDITQYSASRLFVDGDGSIYMNLRPFTGFNTVVPTLLEFKNEVWQSFALPFSPSGLAVDKWTNLIYFTTVSDTIYKYNGSGSFSDRVSYSTIALGSNYSNITIDVSHDSVLAFFTRNISGLPNNSTASGFLIRTGSGNTMVYNYPDSTTKLNLVGIFGSDGKSVYMLGYENNNSLLGNVDSLFIQDGLKWNRIPINLPNNYSTIDNLKNSNDGVIWITYDNRGMAKYENGQFTFHDINDSKPNSHIQDFAFDSDNVKWLACWEGLIRYKIP